MQTIVVRVSNNPFSIKIGNVFFTEQTYANLHFKVLGLEIQLLIIAVSCETGVRECYEHLTEAYSSCSRLFIYLIIHVYY